MRKCKARSAADVPVSGAAGKTPNRAVDRRNPKSTLLRAILEQHNQTENPVSRETAIVLVTLAFRMLEQVWRTCGPEEVRDALRHQERHDVTPDPRDFLEDSTLGRGTD